MVLEICLIVFVVVWVMGILYYLAFKQGYAHGEHDVYARLGYCKKDGSVDMDKIMETVIPKIDNEEDDCK